MRVLLIASAGPGRQAADQLAAHLRRAGAVVAVGGLPDSDLPLDPLVLACTELARGADGLGLIVEAPLLPALLRVHRQACALGGGSGPVVFSGPLEPLSGDLLASDLLHRLEVDLLTLHGPGEVEEASDLVRGSRFAALPMVPLGLWSLPPATGRDIAAQARTVVFLEQPGLPGGGNGKQPLLRLLSRVAAASPGWQLLIQPPASTPARPATSLAEEPLRGLIEQMPPGLLPTNLATLSGNDIGAALERSATCLSISSPWLFHGLALGRQCVVMGDYGIRTDTNAPLFFGSGLMHRLSDLGSFDALPEATGANPHWLRQRGLGIADPAMPLFHALQGCPRR